MLGQGFRRGGSVLFNAGKGALSRRVVMQQRRAMAMSVCLARNISLANTAPNAISSACKLGGLENNLTVRILTFLTR